MFIADILYTVNSKYYVYETGIGPFYITEQLDHFFIFFEDKNLGIFDSASQAAKALASGITFSLFGPQLGELDTSTFGIPPYLWEWEFRPDD